MVVEVYEDCFQLKAAFSNETIMVSIEPSYLMVRYERQGDSVTSA